MVFYRGPEVSSNDESEDESESSNDESEDESESSREENDDDEEYDDWSFVADEPERPLPPFNLASGPHHLPLDIEDLTEYFELLLTDELLHSWVLETERYAKHYINQHRPLQQYSRCHEWDWETRDMEFKLCEMRAFLALSLLMGIVQKPSIEDYWNNSSWAMSTPAFNDVMLLKRYQLLQRFFHTCNNDEAPPVGDPNYDPLFKVKGVEEYLNVKFQQYYIPSQMMEVDESLIGFKGRHVAKKYMPNKHHHQWGVKIWVAAESVTGYTYQFQFYR